MTTRWNLKYIAEGIEITGYKYETLVQNINSCINTYLKQNTGLNLTQKQKSAEALYDIW